MKLVLRKVVKFAMFKFLNKEIIIRKTWRSVLFDCVSCSLLFSVVLYFWLTGLNEGTVEFMMLVADKGVALDVVLMLFIPITIFISLVIIVNNISESYATKKRNEKITKKDK